MKKVLLLNLALGLVGVEHAIACDYGYEGIGYQSKSSESANVVIVQESNPSKEINATVDAEAFHEFCWPITDSPYKITQTFASTGSSYQEFTATDFSNSNYYINVNSNDSAWKASTTSTVGNGLALCPSKTMTGQKQTFTEHCRGKSKGLNNRLCANTYTTDKDGTSYLCQVQSDDCVKSNIKCAAPTAS